MSDSELCDGKYIYASQHEAKKVRRFREHHSPKLRIYKCPKCFGYHLSKQKKQYD
jgi:hypothetical protein